MNRYKIIYLISILFLTSSNLYSQELKIAIGQIVCIDSDRSGNFVRIENAIMEAKSAGADIITFPETSIYGWVNPAAHKIAFPIPGKDSDRLCKLAKENNISICIGLAEKENDKLYDTAILINNKGDIILKHRKMNILKELMTPSYSEGVDIKTVITEFGNIGILICADTFKEEILKRMKGLKPDLLLIPYGWAAPEKSWPEHGMELLKVVQNTAKTVGCPVIGTDLAGKISNGPWTGMTYGGQSVAVNKNGNILGLGKDRDKDIIIVNIKIN
ncbi:carbon-nitrogen hydrolase family protein [Bacteroidota bacterium]